jgi:hypothetical protein
MRESVHELRKRCPEDVVRKAAWISCFRPFIKIFRRFEWSWLYQRFLDLLGIRLVYKRLILQDGKWLKSVDSDARLKRTTR